MVPKLYMRTGSPPVRSVMVCANVLGLHLEMHEVDLLAGENRTPEFLKMNPQHTVPTLVDDDGFVIWDSHAINAYLANKYGKNDSLYPKDPKRRAVVDQRLHFDSNILFPRGVVIVRTILHQGATKIQADHKNDLIEAYDFVEKFIENKDWIAGDTFTIADITYLTTIGTWATMVPLEKSRYPRLTAWLRKMEKLPCHAVNVPGLEFFKSFICAKIEGWKDG